MWTHCHYRRHGICYLLTKIQVLTYLSLQRQRSRMQRGNYLEGLWRECHQHSAWIAQVLLPEREFGGNEKGSCILYSAESLFSEAGPRNVVPVRALSPAFETLVTNVKANFANKGFSGGSVLFSTAGKAARILEWDLKSRFLFFFFPGSGWPS